MKSVDTTRSLRAKGRRVSTGRERAPQKQSPPRREPLGSPHLTPSHPPWYQKEKKTRQDYKFFHEIFQTKDITYGIDGCGLPAIRLKASHFIDSINYIKNSKYNELWNRVFNAYVRFPEIIGGTNRADTNLIKNSNSPLLAKSGAEGVMFVTNNNQSFLFKCLDGSKRGVDLASSYYLKSIGLVNNSPFESQVDLYSMNRQNNKAVEIKISKNF